MKMDRRVMPLLFASHRWRVLVAALVLAVCVAGGAVAVLHAAENLGRCQCETQGWGLMDWQYYYYECWTQRPPECDEMAP